MARHGVALRGDAMHSKCTANAQRRTAPHSNGEAQLGHATRSNGNAQLGGALHG